MKSVPGTASFAATTVANNIVLLRRNITAPSACLANLPVSMLMVRPSGKATVFVITFILACLKYLLFRQYKIAQR